MNFLKSIAGMFGLQEEETVQRDLQRNEPCWCGSGRKYKKCHLQEDENKARRNSAANCGKT